jgi:hypothetical protein
VGCFIRWRRQVMPIGDVLTMRGGLIVSCQVTPGILWTPPRRWRLWPRPLSPPVRSGSGHVVPPPSVLSRQRSAYRSSASPSATSCPPRSTSHPTWKDLHACIAAGTEIMALDATERARPDGLPLAAIVRRARCSRRSWSTSTCRSLPSREDHITTPAHAADALRRGTWAVCVGKAITAPGFLAGLFVRALREQGKGWRPRSVRCT